MKKKVSSYEAFLANKLSQAPSTGMDVDPATLNKHLMPFQRKTVQVALRKGRMACFYDCGLGKTIIALSWAQKVGNVLIVAPLAVTHQTVEEGKRFGIESKFCRSHADVDPGITITNYEMLEHFDASGFDGIVIDESSILKSFTGKYRNMIINKFAGLKYKLACTATPAPNDLMELGNHAEFLEVMTRTEMLSMFFVHDGGDTSQWKLKGHAKDAFWKWVSSWSIMAKTPSDIGFSDEGFILPELRIHQITIETEPMKGGYLFPTEAKTLQERLRARKTTINERVDAIAEIINKSDEPWTIWCGLNAEGESLRKAIPDAIEISGSDSSEDKAKYMLGFCQGKPKKLISKVKIAGFGMNWQHCSKVAFVGLNDSYEQLYQAIRRSYRFGQKNDVDVYIVTADTEGSVVANVKRKEKQAKTLASEIAANMNHEILEETAKKSDYKTGVEKGNGWEIHLGDCVEGVKALKSDSIGYTVFSPPFASLYTYSASERDMGNCKNHAEFYAHFEFLVKELYRVTMPGRNLSFHCMNLQTQKSRDGFIGISDFRGQMIKLFVDAGWIYHSEVTIWKDPVVAMQRTKALGLLHKQLKKDSCMSRQGIPDYLVTMRKPGDNPKRVTHTNESFPVRQWQDYASPVWMDIDPGDTLQRKSAREEDDERHICPLQLEVIRRALRLWSKKGDLVLSPFTGIGSEGYEAIKADRNFIGFELKESYFQQAVLNLKNAERAVKEQSLFAGTEESNDGSGTPDEVARDEGGNVLFESEPEREGSE